MKSMNSGRLQSETVWCILAVTYALRHSLDRTEPLLASRARDECGVTLFGDRPGAATAYYARTYIVVEL